MFENIGEMLVLFWRTLVALPMAWRQRNKIFEHFFEIGNGSLLMVCVLAFFIGGETALQTGPFLAEKSFGGYLGGIVGYSVCRELAPILMAILIAGRSGSAMAAVNGQQMTMTAPAQEFGGNLYAPIGTLAEGLGGRAQYDGQQNVVWLTLGNSRGFVRVP